MKNLFLIFTLLISCNVSFANQDKISDSLDFKLKSLVRNSEFAGALKILKNLSKDTELYNRIKGQILSKKKKYSEANALLNRAYSMSNKDQTLFLMAQNSLKLMDPSSTIKHLNRVKKDSIPLRLMLSQAYWDLGKKEKALQFILKKGFTENELLEKQKYNFLVKLSRIKELLNHVGVYLDKNPGFVEPALFAASLLKEKDLFLSEKVFDLALTKSAGSALLLKERGAFELERNRPEVASYYFVRAAHIDKTYSYEASVTKLLLGRHYEALFHAGNISDPVKRLKQKFFIYLDQEKFDEIVSLQNQLARMNLFKEEKVTYAFLYSAYKAKALEAFNDVFSSYKVKSELTKVMKLKSLLEKCDKSMELECVFS